MLTSPQGCTAAQAELVLSVIHRFDYPASIAQQLQAQVRAMVTNEAPPPALDAHPLELVSKQQRPNWDDLELS